MRGIKLTRLYYYYYCTTSCFFFSSSPFVCVYDFSLTRLLSLSLSQFLTFFFSFLSPYFSTDFSLSFVSLSLFLYATIKYSKRRRVYLICMHLDLDAYVYVFCQSVSLSLSLSISLLTNTHILSRIVYIFFFTSQQNTKLLAVSLISQRVIIRTLLFIILSIHTYIYEYIRIKSR